LRVISRCFFYTRNDITIFIFQGALLINMNLNWSL